MRIDRIDLKIVRLPLVRPFRTSSSRKDHLDHILVRVEADGVGRLGRVRQPVRPVLLPRDDRDLLAHPPRLPRARRSWAASGRRSRSWSGFYRPGEGEQLRQGGPGDGLLGPARAARGQAAGRRCSAARAAEILSGVSLGIERDIEAALRPDRPVPRRGLPADQAQDRARARTSRSSGGSASATPTIAAPGRRQLGLHARRHRRRSRQLDDFGLLLIEQPLAHDDIIDHARLQAELKTPICLDESIHSADDARKALDLGACRVINIKVSRRRRAARGEAGPRPLPGARGARLVRRDARVRHRPRGQRGDREPARLHPARRRLGLGQVLSRGHRRARRSSPTTGAIAVPDRAGARASSRSRIGSRRHTLRDGDRSRAGTLETPPMRRPADPRSHLRLATRTAMIESLERAGRARVAQPRQAGARRAGRTGSPSVSSELGRRRSS